ncbi:2,3-diphosphoglycerate-dependent phosphoglycerate mutase [Ferroplasma sp.]|uniref:2,3-diphosphoglycerate-dependent phosphoglycerate mutase n=1 Tax=Ferroplasma sp. TaxID=2591003 RepID=UPI002639DEBF|nr:2,3-diphosphoglycerate-dependent phosphoglycerate mutase [Ferroplasma sp.]MCL4454015.1 2,3-diphosphoglycerate-dependent phosphoglycerate mutase [Candidatus Thermoplasmatota archaeon]
MKSYIFIRHGESDINVAKLLSDDTENNSLTDQGKQQVERTAMQLRGLKFDGIVSSPIKRAYDTATIISNYTGLSIKIDDRLREVYLGKANGHHITEFQDELYPNSHITGEMRDNLGMEPWDHLWKRVKGCMDDNRGKYIFVSHSDPIRAIASYYLGFSEADSFGMAIKNASMTVIGREPPRVLCLGAINLDDKIRSIFS